MQIRSGKTEDRTALLDVWERSVRATHDFLSEEDIQFYMPLVRDNAFTNLEIWVLTNDDDQPIGFMGLSDQSLDALFIAPEYLRQGGGRMLVEFARKLKGPLTVDVNEQNPEARKFYEAIGFTMVGRSELDGTGRPFPILHLVESESS